MSEEITKDFEKIVPKRWKRYPRYKDSGVEWIGEIPEEWKIFKLANMIHKFVDYRGKTPEKTQYGITLVTARNIKNGRITFDNSKEFISESDYHTWMVRGLPKSGDVLITTEAPLGAVAQVSEQNIALAQRIILLKAKDEMLDTFLKYVLMSQTIQYQLYKEATGSTAAGISSERLKQILIPVTNKDEQKCIVDLLDDEISKIDTLISKKQRLIELLKEKRTAIISRAVTKGLDPNTPMKDSGVEWIGEIPTNWRIFRLKDLARINPSKTEINHLADDLEVSFVPMGSIGEYGGISGAEVKKLLDVKQGYTYFAEGDLIVAKITPCFENYKGAIASDLVNGIGFGTTELFVLRPNERVDLRYLFYVSISKAFRQTGSNMMQGAAGQKRITADFVNNYPVALPRPEEQRSIASSLEKGTEKIDSFISKIEKSIELLKEYRSALITAAVTGKIDVQEEVP